MKKLQKLQASKMQAVDRLMKRREFFSSVTSLQEDTEGRKDAAVGKVRERYHWPNFYKGIKEKVHIATAQATFTITLQKLKYDIHKLYQLPLPKLNLV